MNYIKINEENIKKIKKRIKYRKIINIRNFLIKKLIQSGIAIDYALPFIFSSIIIGTIQANQGNAPFKKDTIATKANIETIDTSNGTHIEHVLNENEKKTRSIEYSTGWKKINNNYERIITSYKIDNINLDQKEEIFNLSKKELDKLRITDIQKISKKELKPEDEIYNKASTIITNYYKSNDVIITRKETTKENIVNSINYLIYVLSIGGIITVIGEKYTKKSIKDKLKKYASCLEIINKKDIEKVKKIIEIKQQNIQMIEDNTNEKIYKKQ